MMGRWSRAPRRGLQQGTQLPKMLSWAWQGGVSNNTQYGFLTVRAPSVVRLEGCRVDSSSTFEAFTTTKEDSETKGPLLQDPPPIKRGRIAALGAFAVLGAVPRMGRSS